MAHHINPASTNEAIPVSCSPVGPFIPNALYVLTGAITSLGPVDIYTKALTVNELSISVDVVWPNEGTELVFAGIYDWVNCNIDYLEDRRGNRINGFDTIDAFPWTNPAWSNNTVLAGGQIIPPATPGGTVNGNLIGGGGLLDLTAMQVDTQIIDNEVLSNSTLSVTTNVGLVLIQRNHLICGSFIIVQAGTEAVENVFVNSGSLTTGGFDITSCELIGDSSTLVSDETLSRKTGYVGALP